MWVASILRAVGFLTRLPWPWSLSWAGCLQSQGAIILISFLESRWNSTYQPKEVVEQYDHRYYYQNHIEDSPQGFRREVVDNVVKQPDHHQKDNQVNQQSKQAACGHCQQYHYFFLFFPMVFPKP
jgi:hypothetical protein